MASYSELMAQAQNLMAQAEQARKDELASVIADIKAKMKQFGITAADLGGASSGAGKKAGKSKSGAPAKYRGPNGELWAGGSALALQVSTPPRAHRIAALRLDNHWAAWPDAPKKAQP